eukprot:CAMPEP_0119331482 /NCGR_PEP_ID=MMETSP1333-20130426/80707_1 /TAXON_ID=418940 /ORGANISM="Scyphosphaera apsteinii, Strain RCC1455" /LENGTH=126 /DNA_ID=CAMNT_0007341099 /DNA_START=470 /DNA_END=850 /DNA_ORIENTATION=+
MGVRGGLCRIFGGVQRSRLAFYLWCCSVFHHLLSRRSSCSIPAQSGTQRAPVVTFVDVEVHLSPAPTKYCGSSMCVKGGVTTSNCYTTGCARSPLGAREATVTCIPHHASLEVLGQCGGQPMDPVV